MTVACPSLDVPPTRVKRPRQTIRDVAPNGVDAFDVAGDNYVVGSKDRYLRFGRFTSQQPVVEPDLKSDGHVSDITLARFFPSGEVVLTASSDMSIRLWGVSTGRCARVLKGHTRTVQAASIIGIGRNIVSASSDATVRLWDVATGAGAGGLRTWKLGAEALSIACGSRPSGMEGGLTPPDGDESAAMPAPPVEPHRGGVPAEVETDGKLVVSGLRNGHAALIDLSSKRLIADLPSRDASTSPLWAIDYSASAGLVATGNGAGIVSILDLRNMSTPLVSWRRAEGSRANDVLFSSDGSLLVAGSDGLPYRASFAGTASDGPHPVVLEEFAGLDTDSVEVIREANGAVYTGSADGALRRY